LNNLLNRSSTKKFIIAKITSLRPGMEKQITRVSKEALDNYEARLRAMIESDIMIHPSLGKTFR
jgi:hypothetical protein